MPPPFSNRRANTSSPFLGSSMSTSTRRSRADSSIFNTSTMSTTTDGFLCGYNVRGEEIQKRLNSAQRKKTFPKTTKQPKFTGYTMSEDELLPFLGAKYENGRGQFWAIVEIINFSKNKELPFKQIYQIYYYLYKHVLDEKHLRGIFNADPSKFARNIFRDENEIFIVRGTNPDFFVSLTNPDVDHVPPEIREQERKLIFSKFENQGNV
uniref:Uncharacterized protein n=1 Tax=Panagrolaimus davidi TaxID=227884 RepID=A0A914PGE9_9BILA